MSRLGKLLKGLTTLASLGGLFFFVHFVMLSQVITPVPADVAQKLTVVPVTPDHPPFDLREWRREQAATQAAQAAQAAAQAKAAAAAKAKADADAKAAADKAAADKAAADAAAKAKAAAATPTPPPTPAPTPKPTPTPAPVARGTGVAAYQAYAASKVNASEYSCLVSMWNRESGWNPNAQNPTSTAYGIAQFLDSTWATVGFSKTSDPYAQIDAGIAYVNKAYGGACAAWTFWQANNYY